MYPNFRNIIRKIESPALEKVRDKVVVTDEMIEKLLTVLIETEQYQKACVFALAMASGARLSELLQFKVWYFDDKYLNNGIYKTPEKIRLKGKGERGLRKNKYTLKAAFKKYFDLWVEERTRLGITSEYLFVTKNDEGQWVQAQDSTLHSWNNKFKEILGIPIYLHAMRHYLCTLLRKNNLPDKAIQLFFAWQTIDMINVYDDAEGDDNFDMFFNDEGIISQHKKDLSNDDIK
jgi:integrase